MERKVSTIRRCIKDPFPGLSHWFGMLLAIIGFASLLVLADGRPRYIVAFAVYGTALVLVYLASAVAHSLHCKPETEELLNRLDYAAIFLMIAGTYTPICLIALPGAMGWFLLAAVWALAVIGIRGVFAKKAFSHRTRVMLYVAMGWLCLAGAGELLHAPAFGWLLAGGIVYSLGAIVFLTDRPNLWPGRFVAHDLWHCMVLAGSTCHFIMMTRFVA